MVEVASAELQSAVGVVKCALLSQRVSAAGVVRVVLGSAGLRLLATDLERWGEICVGEAPGEGAQEVGVQAKRLMGHMRTESFPALSSSAGLYQSAKSQAG